MRLYKLYAGWELAAAHEAASAALNQWCERWLPPGMLALSIAEVTAWQRPPVAQPAVLWFRAQLEDEAAYIGTEKHFLVDICRAIVGQPHSDADGAEIHPMVSGLALEALKSWIEIYTGARCAELRRVEDGVPDAFDESGSGALVAEITAAVGRPANCSIVLSQQLAARVIAKSPHSAGVRPAKLKPLSGRNGAIGPTRIRVEVIMAEDAITLGDVRDLRPNDVVLFNWPLRRPLRVRLADGVDLGGAHLGRIEGKRGVKLTKERENARGV